MFYKKECKINNFKLGKIDSRIRLVLSKFYLKKDMNFYEKIAISVICSILSNNKTIAKLSIFDLKRVIKNDKNWGHFGLKKPTISRIKQKEYQEVLNVLIKKYFIEIFELQDVKRKYTILLISYDVFRMNSEMSFEEFETLQKKESQGLFEVFKQNSRNLSKLSEHELALVKALEKQMVRKGEGSSLQPK